MIPVSSLRFIDDLDDNFELPPRPEGEAGDEAPADAAPGPQVFVRTLSTAPAWPWDQTRSADLEARHGAPLPMGELRYRLRRLEPWRPGAAGRFAAFYVLARDVQGRLEATATVEGQEHTVTFLAGRQRLVVDHRRLASVALIGGMAALLALAVGSSVSRRSEASAALQLADQRLSGRLRQLEARQKVRDEGRLLQAEADSTQRLRAVVDDLRWVANAKADEARLEAVHWEPGLLAVEVRGEASPFRIDADRQLEREDRPLRKGVWLWGVAPADPENRAASPEEERR